MIIKTQNTVFITHQKSLFIFIVLTDLYKKTVSPFFGRAGFIGVIFRT